METRKQRPDRLDKIPRNIEMRTKTLIGKHEDHGWSRDFSRISKSQIDRVFYRCPCGWFGWVDRFE